MGEKPDLLCAELSLTAEAKRYTSLVDQAARKKHSFVEYLEQVLRVSPGSVKHDKVDR